MPDFIPTPSDLCQSSPIFWSVASKLKFQGQMYSFDNGRDYLLGILGSTARRLAMNKGTQLGGTLALSVVWPCWAMIYRRLPTGVTVVFPTSDNVNDFSRQRWEPFIRENGRAVGRFVRTQGKGSDRVDLKTVGLCNLVFKGATQTKTMADGRTKESDGTRSFPTDMLIFEEVDVHDPGSTYKFLMRMGESPFKYERYLSNPTGPGTGIDAYYQQGDQRHFHRKCGCGEWVCALKLFLEDPEKAVGVRDGRGFIRCPKCGASAGPREGPPWAQLPGEWVADEPKNRDKWGESYQLNQFLSLRNDPAEILQDFRHPQQGSSLSTVYQQRLGLARADEQEQLAPKQVLECCGSEAMAESHYGPCAMGVDVGDNACHITIGCRTGEATYQVLKVATVNPEELKGGGLLDSWSERFHVRVEVIDSRPNHQLSVDRQKAAKHQVWLCHYTETPRVAPDFNDKDQTVTAYRTGLLDVTHGIVAEKRVMLPRKEIPAIKEYAVSYARPARFEEIDKKTGVRVNRYNGPKDDHKRHSFGYFVLGADRLPIYRGESSWESKPRKAKTACSFRC